jgi:carboxyl-terminal processing protease
MKRFLPIKIIIIVFLVFLVYLYAEHKKVDYRINQRVQTSKEMFYELGLFADAIALVDANYVKSVSAKEMIYGALEGMLSSLDSHSSFLSPEHHAQLKADAAGEFGGLGIRVTMRDNILTVVSPLEDGPADQAGIAPGDKIIKIDDKSTKDFNLDDAVELLRGRPGTTVKLTVIRDAEQSIEEFDIKRAIIKLESIKQAIILKDDVGYIRIADFQKNTVSSLNKSLRHLIRNGMKSLIIDVRNNPGGLLEASIAVSERFLEPDSMIASVKGRIEDQNAVFKAKIKKPYVDFPIVILINKGSASASEIVAGSLRDNKRAVILGEKSFGKGSVQTVIPMKDDSALRLTTSYYYTPSGKVIHEKGINPDIILPFKSMDTDEDIDEKNPERLSTREKLLKDNQVNEAIKLLKNKQGYADILK